MLGITDVDEEGAVSAVSKALRGPELLACLDVLRIYVAKVEASVEADEPDTRTVADALLGPLTSWESAKPKKTEPALPA